MITKSGLTLEEISGPRFEVLYNCLTFETQKLNAMPTLNNNNNNNNTNPPRPALLTPVAAPSSPRSNNGERQRQLLPPLNSSPQNKVITPPPVKRTTSNLIPPSLGKTQRRLSGSNLKTNPPLLSPREQSEQNGL
jgi:hypothetical protein